MEFIVVGSSPTSAQIVISWRCKMDCWFRASELAGGEIIVGRGKTHRVAKVQPPRGRLDRVVRVEIKGGEMWSLHPGDEVLVRV
jgi:hypothetical protein